MANITGKMEEQHSIMSRKAAKTVLVVSDAPRISDIIAKQKSFNGCKTILASNGEEALRIASRHRPIDFLYTDIMLDNGYSMPEINGVDFARQFIKLYPKTSVLYMIL